ncbi:MAG: FHA domain-containing protein [Deltaproteobacteria bacterium]|nr:FHA domain-containing protein [Deltaproteobacteria bacterium]
MAAFKLIIEDDAGKQIIVPFAKDVITIGRKEGNTIRLTERNVSRKHARLTKENGHVLVEDLESYNGIRLNGERISGRVQVSEGDTIQIGDYHLAIHSQEGAAAKPSGSGDPNATAQMRSVSAPTTMAPEDDEFAGDTQRWEAPAELSPVPVGNAMLTQEEPAVIPTATAEEAAPSAFSSAVAADDGNAFASSADSARAAPFSPLVTVTVGGSATQSARKHEIELEPTVRQAASPAPVSVPGSGHLGEVPRPSAPPPALGSGPNPALAEDTATMRAPASPGEDVALPRLVVLNTIFAGSAFPLRTTEQVIGRTDENDITIEHRSVSRNHAKLVREGDRVRILDLKSANGVLVNDEEVEQAVLQSGDVVELGRVRMRFVPVGERFSVPPDEIERARIADAAGDDFESDAGTGITNPVRPKTAQVSSSDLAIPSSTLGLRKLPVPVLAGAGVLVVLLIIIVVLLSRGDDEQPAVTPLRPEDPRVVVDPPVDPPPPDPPADPALTDPAVPPPDPTPPAPDGAVDPNVDPAPDPAARPPDPTRVKRPEPRMSKADIDSAILQARTFYLQGKHEKAIEAIKPVTKADKNNDAAWKLLGMAAQKLGKLRTMCTAYDELLRLRPTGVDAEQARANRKAANCK